MCHLKKKALCKNWKLFYRQIPTLAPLSLTHLSSHGTIEGSSVWRLSLSKGILFILNIWRKTVSFNQIIFRYRQVCQKKFWQPAELWVRWMFELLNHLLRRITSRGQSDASLKHLLRQREEDLEITISDANWKTAVTFIHS